MEDLCADLVLHPVDLAIAQFAGRVEGEQAAKGIVIRFGDRVIGATAIHRGFDVVTGNEKHFRLIPKLRTGIQVPGARESQPRYPIPGEVRRLLAA
jgi:predicted nucleic acid-binding protein